MSQATIFNPPADARVPELAPAPSAAGRALASQSLFVLVVLAAQMMVVLDATIVNVALPHIRAALGFSAAGLSWVLNAYVLTFGGLMLLGARSGDLQGRRRTFLFGTALFTLGSMLGGFAGSPWQLLAARAFQGVGAAFAAPSALGLLTAAFPEGRERVRAIALYTMVAPAGGMTSASLAGVEPADAGAASGLVNVVQQLGAALGLAVLVTVYSDASHGGLAKTVVVHGLHEAFFAGAVFAGAAIALVALGVRVNARRP